MTKITKAIIPVAGFGTRFLPVTKAQPKEMLPVLDKPTIQYVVEEAVASGITDIIIVTSWNKRAIEDHFDNSVELENWLEINKKFTALEQIKKIANLANFSYIRQKGPHGNGTPVLNCRHIIGNEPFAVLWGDEFFYGPKPRLQELLEVYEKYESPVLTAYEVSLEDTKKYGMIAGTEIDTNVMKISTIIEKPGPDKTPSLLAAMGGYILTPDIFEILEHTSLGKDNELWLVDAIFELAKTQPIYAKKVSSHYYDIGSKMSWLKANIDLALNDPEISLEINNFLKTKI
jgi:UTP--glucose-1-phosphate uridylyltransferase